LAPRWPVAPEFSVMPALMVLILVATTRMESKEQAEEFADFIVPALKS